MSKIANDGLTGSGTGCFIAGCTDMATVGVNGLSGVVDKTTCDGGTSQLRDNVLSSSHRTNGASVDGGRVIVLPSVT